MTEYSEIFDRFLRKVADKDFYDMSESDLEDELTGLMQSAVARMQLQHVRIENDLSNRRDDAQQFRCNLNDIEQELIAYYMLIQWYEPKVNSMEHTLLFIGSKDERWTPQRDHFRMMNERLESVKNEARKLYRDYHTLSNSYLEGK